MLGQDLDFALVFYDSYATALPVIKALAMIKPLAAPNGVYHCRIAIYFNGDLFARHVLQTVHVGTSRSQ